MRELGFTWKEIAVALGGTRDSWRMLVGRRVQHRVDDPNDVPDSYNKGVVARLKALPTTACPYPAITCHWAWWLAGWGDQDRCMI